MTLTFHPDATATCLYSDAIPLATLGTLRVRRASWIDFNEATQEWEVRLSPNPYLPPYFSSPSREECLHWEHEQLDK